MSLSRFESHDLQILLALFLTKPELYADYKSQRNLQDYFFTNFLKFVKPYFQSADPDTYIYFGSVLVSDLGSMSVCGGMGKISGASKSYFKSRVFADLDSRKRQIEEFKRKYRVNFDKSDPRIYLGETEIWKKLDRAAEIVANSAWPNVSQMAYSDYTFATHIPDLMDKRLVPIEIRNKVCQKHKAKTQTSVFSYRPILDLSQTDLEEETRFLQLQQLQQQKPPMYIPAKQNATMNLTDVDLEDW